MEGGTVGALVGGCLGAGCRRRHSAGNRSICDYFRSKQRHDGHPDRKPFPSTGTTISVGW
jgi:hypothetical protein